MKEGGFLIISVLVGYKLHCLQKQQVNLFSYGSHIILQVTLNIKGNLESTISNPKIINEYISIILISLEYPDQEIKAEEVFSMAG